MKNYAACEKEEALCLLSHGGLKGIEQSDDGELTSMMFETPFGEEMILHIHNDYFFIEGKDVFKKLIDLRIKALSDEDAEKFYNYIICEESEGK